MSFKKMSVSEIERWAGVRQSDCPRYLIVDCAWPWSRSVTDAEKYLKNPKPHCRWTFPFFGYHPKLSNVPLGYSVVFGSSMATQLYFFLKLGVKYVFQIGSIGGLQKDVNVFDLIIPSECKKFDWTSQQFHSPENVRCDNKLMEIMESSLKVLNFKDCHIGRTISVASNWIETPSRIAAWKKEGLIGVDQETSMIYSMCKAMGSKAIALLRVTDAHRKGEGQQDHPNKDKTKETILKNTVRDAILLSIESIEEQRH
jgi:purine-nucleoside phosphorylase